MSIKTMTNPGLYSKKVQGYRSGNFYTQNTVKELNNAKTDSQYMSSMRKLENQHRETEKRDTVIDQSMNYAKSLETSRTKEKDAALQKKKLQYSYKKISSQVLRSKTSTSARSAASAAKREVMRLKRLKGNEDYDQEELEISIEHAKAMERVARKKLHHLQQEEMIERTGSGLSESIEEREETKDDNTEDPKDYQDDPDSSVYDSNISDSNYRDYGAEMAANTQHLIDLQEEYQYELEEAQEEMSELASENAKAVSDMTDEMTAEMQRAMEDMMEELDLTELSETLYAPDPNMSEDDLKMLKIKHRNKEMKDIVKADADYLKATFEKHEADKKAGIDGSASYAASSTPAMSSAVGSSSPAPIPQITIAAPYGSGQFNITI
jgi:hypothetical protein